MKKIIALKSLDVLIMEASIKNIDIRDYLKELIYIEEMKKFIEELE